MRGFDATNVDLTLRRQFQLHERLTLQARADLFNIFNHPNFGNPINYLSSPQFGQSTQMLGASLGSGGQNGGLQSPLSNARRAALRASGSKAFVLSAIRKREMWEDVAVMTTIGVIGAGHIGSQVARLAVASGYKIVISNSRGPETLAALVAELGPNARAATVLEAAVSGDIVVVSVPLKNYRAIPVEPLAGKIVIDTNNYYPERDGHIPELDSESTTTSELLQAHLPTAKVVKAFNHIYAAELTTHGQPAGTKNRRALVIAGNDDGAKTVVTHLLDQSRF